MVRRAEALWDLADEPELEAVRMAVLVEDVFGVALPEGEIDPVVLSEAAAVRGRRQAADSSARTEEPRWLYETAVIDRQPARPPVRHPTGAVEEAGPAIEERDSGPPPSPPSASDHLATTEWSSPTAGPAGRIPASLPAGHPRHHLRADRVGSPQICHRHKLS
jgi:hypothetical protein